MESCDIAKIFDLQGLSTVAIDRALHCQMLSVLNKVVSSFFVKKVQMKTDPSHRTKQKIVDDLW